MARAAAARVAAPARAGKPRRAAAPTRRRASAAPAPARRSAPPRSKPRSTTTTGVDRGLAKRRGADRGPGRRRAAAARPGIVARTAELARARAATGIESLLHGPGLIAIVFVLLVGVVFANVALLQKNRQVTSDAARVSELKRENATLRAEVAELGSSERIQQVAAERGLVLPAPDAVHYLRSNPDVDAVAAAKQIDAGTALAAAPTYTDPAATPTTTTAPTSYDANGNPVDAYGNPVDAYGNPIAATPPATTYDAYGNPTTTGGTAIAGTPDAVTQVTAGVP